MRDTSCWAPWLYLLVTPVLFVGDPGTFCWRPRYFLLGTPVLFVGGPGTFCWGPRYFLLGTPVVLVGDPGNSCWAPRYVRSGVSRGRMRRVFGLFARFSGVLGRPPDRDPCWGPRYFLLGTPVVASVLTLPGF